MHPKKRRIGIRVVDNEIVRALLTELGQPLMSSTLILPGKSMPETDPEDIRDALEKQVDLIIDGGYCGFEPTTVINMAENPPQLVRQGKGTDHGLSAD
jgi:tRNA threonylcarbamoyl adenosine modification protein (Sua5/YciO/YrdC/YwlC family)